MSGVLLLMLVLLLPSAIGYAFKISELVFEGVAFLLGLALFFLASAFAGAVIVAALTK